MTRPAVDLDRLGYEILVMMAVGIVRELFGDAQADRCKASPPERHRIVRFIRDNDPECR